jgi:hypothetical protein
MVFYLSVPVRKYPLALIQTIELTDKAHSSGNTAQAQPPQEVVAWFSTFTPFIYDSTTGLKSNFDRLAVQRRWGAKLRNKRWKQCQLVAFAALYGCDTDVDKLEKWQDLCREVHIKNVPESITNCKKVC